jgi:hypothetical protein
MKNLLRSSFVTLLLLSPGCSQRPDRRKEVLPKEDGRTVDGPNAAPAASSAPDAKKSSKAEENMHNAAPIGNAAMAEDGTITLYLRAESPGGIVGDGRLVYKKDDKGYAEVLEHLGGLQPGQSKPVPPWPDK